MVAAAITKTSDKKKVSRGRMSGARDVNHALTSWSVRCLIAFPLFDCQFDSTCFEPVGSLCSVTARRPDSEHDVCTKDLVV